MAKKKARNRAPRTASQQANQSANRANRKLDRKSSSSSTGTDLFSEFGKLNISEDKAGSSVDAKLTKIHLNEQNAKDSGRKPRGLMNLGNTCFANSTLQVLSQTRLLRNRLGQKIVGRVEWNAPSSKALKFNLNRLNDDDDNMLESDAPNGVVDTPGHLEILLREPSKLTVLLAVLLSDIACSDSTGAICPSGVINAVSAKYSQFKGRQQQDAQEFLRCLLDIVRTDEVRRQRLSILDALHIDVKKTSNHSDETKALVKSFGEASNFTLIEEVFGGLLLSSVKCEECESTSQHFEPFFDLSLSVSEEKQKHKTCGRKSKDTQRESVEEPASSLLQESHQKLSAKERRNKRQMKKAAKREARLQKKSGRKATNGQVSDALDDGSNLLSETIEPETVDKVDDHSDHVDEEEEIHEEGESKTNHEEGDEIHEEENAAAKDDGSLVDLPAQVESPLPNGDDDADDEGISDEDKSIAQGVSEFDSVDFSREEKVFDANSAERQSRVRTLSVGIEEKDLKEKVKWTLSPISHRAVEPGTSSILTCLASYTSPELLVGANKIICENCGKHYKDKTGIERKVYSNASKHTIIAFPPPVLTFHLKRFEADGCHSANLRKVNRPVAFPLCFDLAPFVSNIYHPLCELLSFPNNAKCLNYSLYGVIEHSGSLRGGHYTAYVKVSSNGGSGGGGDKLDRLPKLLPHVSDVQALLEKIDLLRYSNQVCLVNGDRVASTENEVSSEAEDSTHKAERAGKWYHISDSVVSNTNVDNVLRSQAYVLLYERI